MKGMLKRVTCMLMAGLMVFSLTACFGKDRGESSSAIADASDPEAAKQAVFKEVGVLSTEDSYVENVFTYGEDLIVVWSEYIDNYSENYEDPVEDLITEEEGIAEDDVADGEVMPEVEYYPEEEYHYYIKMHIGKTQFGGTSLSVIDITLPEDESNYGMTIDQNTGNYIILSEYGEEDYSDPNNYIYKQHFFLNVYSQQGELLNRTELDLGNEDDWYGISGYGIAGNGDICIVGGNKIYVFDSSLQKAGEIHMSDTAWVENFFVTSEGVPYVSVWTEGAEYSTNSFYEVDTMQLRVGSAIEAPKDFWGSPKAGAGHDMYFSTDKGVYTYDFDTLETTLILDFMDSDIDYNYFNYCVPVDETHIVAIMNDPETWQPQITFMEKVPPEEVADEIIITIGMLYADYDVRTKAIEFNKANDKYRIRMIEYYGYNNESDWNAGQKMLNNDIITSNAPDIILLNSQMPIESFKEKGVFLNLNPYIEADEEISKEDMAPNILALGSVGDDTYFLTASFMVSTMAMKASLVPNGSSISLKELMSIEGQNGNILAYQDVTQQDIIRYAMEMNYSQFLDVKSGTCAFNTQEFYDLLEYAKKYPAEIDWENMDDDYWMNSQYALREGRALIQYSSIYSFNGIAYTEQGTFGEKVAFVGFPGNNGVTGTIYPYIQMAISADCENPDAAWEFMRQFYTYEAQSEMSYGLPVNLDAMDELMEEAQQKPYWIDENGEKIEYDETYWINDQEIIIEPLTQERALEIKEYVLSVDTMYFYDSAIVDIILEEAAPYFANQKSAEQVADIIQSRVQIYVNENQ